MSVFVTSSLKIDESGLMLRKNEANRKLWLNGFNDVLELKVFATKPDIPVQLTDKAGLTMYYQAAAKTQSAEVLDLEVREVVSIQAIRLTMRAVAKPTGFTYVSSLALPFRDGSFVLKIQALETIARDDNSQLADELHPAHGLTRVRSELTRLEQTLQLEAAVLQQPQFGKKPFWKLF